MPGIFFDTNVLFYDNGLFRTEDFKRLRDAKYTLLTSDVVIAEGKDKNYREILNRFEKLEKLINDNKTDMYFHTKEKLNVNLENAYKESNDNIEKFIENDFCGIIIPLIEEKAIDVLLDRYHFKNPPFSTCENASDKGWKDTLIWISLIEFARRSEIEQYYFVSNDKCFLDNADVLAKEFSEKTKKQVQFLGVSESRELFEELGLEKKKAIYGKDEMPEEKVKNAKEAIRDIMFLTTVDGFGNNVQTNSFKFKDEFTEKEAEEFCETLSEKYKDFLFEEDIDLGPILRKIKVYCEVNAVFFYEEIKRFVEVWNEIKTKYSSEKTAFLTAIKDHFNKMVSQSEYDDLPF